MSRVLGTRDEGNHSAALDTTAAAVAHMSETSRTEYFAWCAKHRRAPLKQRTLRDYAEQHEGLKGFVSRV